MESPLSAPTVAGVAAIILAGGASRRMGQPKALLDFDGQSLLSHMVARVRPHCAALAICAGDTDPAGMAGLAGLPALSDGIPGQAGPLAGILAGLDWLHGTGCGWLLSVPVDMPFLPGDLVAGLHAATGAGVEIVTAASGGRSHHTTSLWRGDLAAPLRAYLDAGGRAVGAFTAGRRVRTVAWPGEPVDPFLNLNTPDDLERARRSWT